MDGYFPLKMKRKNLEKVFDGFSDFSSSFPARNPSISMVFLILNWVVLVVLKDAKVSPIMEEPIGYDQMMPKEEQKVSPKISVEEVEDDVIIVPYSENEGRAIVLYKPMNSPLLNSLSCSDNFLYGLSFCHRGSMKDLDNKEERKRKINAGVKGESLVVVPWVAYS
ncbi:hypothetical protein MKX01_021139 [Papaver californicum]|nr:hypothetical protein MKX01_021139 [Papaver californicum]